MSTKKLPLMCVPMVLSERERARSIELREKLNAATRTPSAIRDGVLVTLVDDAEAFRLAAEWITLERRCCPFLSFELSWGAEAEGPALSITGPEGTSAILGNELPALAPR